MKRAIFGMTAVALAVGGAGAQTLTAKATFGGGDGWRAPNEVLAGDTAGTATGANYNYLQTGNLERGLAYNPITGNLILVSRSSAGNGIRILNGQSGVDVGALNQGSGIISGGTFTTNMVGVADDGAVYVGNLQANVTTGAYKVYSWANEAASAPTTFFNSTISGFTPTAGTTSRLGDSLDVTGSGAGTTLVAGVQNSTGYAIINGSGATAVSAFSGTAPTTGDFRLGITFGATAGDVYGKQTSTNLKETSYSGSAGTGLGSVALTSAGETAMDFTTFGGVNYLATIDANNSTVRVYDMTSPLAPSLVSSLTTTSGTLTGNANGVGSVQVRQEQRRRHHRPLCDERQSGNSGVSLRNARSRTVQRGSCRDVRRGRPVSAPSP